ncbi:MAG: hypothetical protein IT453_15955 [Planctomycetes bacterium]|nr:hypothetical protein [Planctomycetota bacterium]
MTRRRGVRLGSLPSGLAFVGWGLGYGLVFGSVWLQWADFHGNIDSNLWQTDPELGPRLTVALYVLGLPSSLAWLGLHAMPDAWEAYLPFVPVAVYLGSVLVNALVWGIALATASERCRAVVRRWLNARRGA